MPTAYPIIDSMPVQTFYTMPDGVSVVEMHVGSYAEFCGMPAAIRMDGKTYGKSGWNSDVNVVYYRSDKVFARPVH